MTSYQVTIIQIIITSQYSIHLMRFTTGSTKGIIPKLPEKVAQARYIIPDKARTYRSGGSSSSNLASCNLFLWRYFFPRARKY